MRMLADSAVLEGVGVYQYGREERRVSWYFARILLCRASLLAKLPF